MGKTRQIRCERIKMQVNRINGTNINYVSYQNTIKNPNKVSFKGVDLGCGFIYEIRSKSDKINDLVEEKTKFAETVRKDAKETFKRVQKYLGKGSMASFRPIETDNQGAYVVFADGPMNWYNPSSAILYKTQSFGPDILCEKYKFSNEKMYPLSNLIVKKYDDGKTREYEFNNCRLVFYEETKNDGSNKVRLIPTGRKSFKYEEEIQEGDYFANTVKLDISGRRNNKRSIVTLNENGANNEYMYNPTKKKWKPIKTQK